MSKHSHKSLETLRREERSEAQKLDMCHRRLKELRKQIDKLEKLESDG